MLKRIHIFVSGRVQGVFFRSYTVKAAKTLPLVGWVKNLHDSRVEIVAEGDESSLKELLSWCYIGSPLSHVKEVVSTWEEKTGEFNSFDII